MVGEYKWTLRKGGGKMICPKCGQRRFVPYVSTLDGKTLAGSEYGRCDREQSCGYQLYPGKDVNAGDIKPVEVKIEPPLRFYPARGLLSWYSIPCRPDTGRPIWPIRVRSCCRKTLFLSF